MERIKTFSPADPEPRRITHVGDDEPFAQDSLPPTEIGSFAVNLGQDDIRLHSLLEGSKLRSFTQGANTVDVLAGNSSKRGSEPLVMFFTYRQALSTGKGDSTAGSLRQWECKLYPSVRLSPQSNEFGEGASDKVYQATPTKVNKSVWNEGLTEANWEAVSAEYFRFNFNAQPRLNWWLGTPTISSFQLSHAPRDADNLFVFVAGTLQTPSSVNTSTANPAFTLSSPPANGNFVFAVIGTDVPGNS
jgi:hypothetical protein